MIEQILRAPSLAAPGVGAVGVAVVIGGSLAFRRHWPLSSYVAGSAALMVQSLWIGTSTITPYANLIGLFSLGVYGSRRHALWGPVLLVPGVLAYFSGVSEFFGIFTISVFGVWFAGWALGYQLARNREQSLLAREASRRETLAAERVRIARELHDVVGHTVNLILVQAGASRLTMDHDRATSKELLGDVETAARQALDELDQMLGLLRDDAEPRTRPGLRELPALCERLAAIGLTVDLDIEPSSLPAQLDVVVYRIVQEALTNALRHGKASTAQVRVIGTERLIIDITDTGHGPINYTPGRGLRGMSERVALFGGTLEHRRDSRGFHVHAELEAP
ncbi:MAG: histidine kinase [Ilumatobacteraceae bacterium]